MLRSCSDGPCQKHLPSSGSLKFKQTTVQLQGRRKGGEAAPGSLEINWKFRRLLLPPVVQLGKKEMISRFAWQADTFHREMLNLPQAQRLQSLVSRQLPRGGGGVKDCPVTAGDAPLAPELLPALGRLRAGHTLVLQILASNLTGRKFQCHLKCNA